MTEDPKQEDSKKSEPASKGQGTAGSRKDGSPGQGRQQAAQGPKPAADKAPDKPLDKAPDTAPEKTPEKAKPPAAPAAATPPSAPGRAEVTGKEPESKELPKSVSKDSAPDVKGPVATGSPVVVTRPGSSGATRPDAPVPGAPLATSSGAPSTPAAPPPAGSGPTPPSAKPTPLDKPAPDAVRTPSASSDKAGDKAGPSGPAKPGVAEKPAGGQPAVEPWKPAAGSTAGPAAAASAASSQPSRSEPPRPDSAPDSAPDSGEKKAERTPDPSAPRPGGPGGKAPQPPAASTAPKRRTGCLALSALLAVLVIGGLLTAPYWLPAVAPYVQNYLPAQPDNAQAAALEDRIAALERTVQQSAVQQDDVAALQQDTQSLREQMDALGGRLQDVEPGVTAVVPEWVDERLNAVRSEREQLEQRVGRLDEQLAGLDQRLAGLDQAVAGLDQPGAGGDEKVAGLERQMTQLQEELTGLEEQVRSLSDQLTSSRDGSQDAAAVALGLSRLSETVGTSRSYREELDAFKSLADQAVLDEESLRPLEAYAQTGVATFTDLYRRFPEMAEAVAHAGVERNDEGVLATTLNRLRSLVSVRRTGEAALAAGGAEAALEVARNRMDAGDLAGAIDALAKLEGAEAQAAAWWLDAARSRLAVQRAMERIQIRAIAMLSSKEGSSR